MNSLDLARGDFSTMEVPVDLGILESSKIKKEKVVTAIDERQPETVKTKGSKSTALKVGAVFAALIGLALMVSSGLFIAGVLPSVTSLTGIAHLAAAIGTHGKPLATTAYIVAGLGITGLSAFMYGRSLQKKENVKPEERQTKNEEATEIAENNPLIDIVKREEEQARKRYEASRDQLAEIEKTVIPVIKSPIIIE